MSLKPGYTLHWPEIRLIWLSYEHTQEQNGTKTFNALPKDVIIYLIHNFLGYQTDEFASCIRTDLIIRDKCV
jgi:hypothetical protein